MKPSYFSKRSIGDVKMKKWIVAILFMAIVLTLSACNNNDSEIVAETSAGNVTKDELYEAMKKNHGESVLQTLIYEKILSAKYDVTEDEVNAKLDELKNDLGASFELALMQYNLTEESLKNNLKLDLLIEKAAADKVEVTEEEIQEYYDNYTPEIHARHILVETKETADEVVEKLNAGEDFAKLAEEYSTDTGSATNGGDLGWFGPGKMVKEFEEAAYALDVNEISEPVESTYGFHIIQVLEKEEKQSLDEMRAKIEQEIRRTKLDNDTVTNILQQELKNANVKITDKDLKSILKNEE